MDSMSLDTMLIMLADHPRFSVACSDNPHSVGKYYFVNTALSEVTDLHEGTTYGAFKRYCSVCDLYLEYTTGVLIGVIRVTEV